MEGDERPYEVGMAERGFIDRRSLGNDRPDFRFELPPESAATLRRWLGQRYTGHAFPDAFNARIDPLLNGKKPHLKRLFETLVGRNCCGLYVRLDPLDEELPATRTYRLDTVVLLYRDEDLTSLGGHDALREFEVKVRDCLTKTRGVEVGQVRALSDADVAHRELRRLIRWQLDYISMRDSGDPPARVPPTD